jgi:Ser-tRNA(Ala) deacylase AlaX
MTKIGALACQKDSYIKNLISTVVSCEKEGNLYAIQLQDTVFFPTGGGQNCDFGTIDSIPVIDVQRRGLDCIHFLNESLKPGSTVSLEINWKRRFDHMQQHSGQHLLSALLEKHLKLETLGWGMGLDKNYIDLSRSLTEAELDLIESITNESIRSRIEITVEEENNSAEKPDSLPQDLKELDLGTLRWIHIQDLDRNPCCGTHVSNTSELQCFKFYHQEKAKKNTRVYFAFGDRVLKAFHQSLEREKSLTSLLSSGPQDFVDRVGLLVKDLKETKKMIKNSMTEIASLLPLQWSTIIQECKDGLFFYYRSDGDIEFFSYLAKLLQSSFLESTFLLYGGESGGPLLIVGNASKVEQLSLELGQSLKQQIKGGGKNGRYQAKATSWNGMDRFLRDANVKCLSV